MKVNQPKNDIPRFQLDRENNHLREIQRIVTKKIQEQQRHSMFWVQLKAFLFPLSYIGLYVWALYNADNRLIYYSSFLLMGFLIVIIFLTVIHEVSHDNIFKSKKLNRLVLYFFDLLGANSYIWKQRHQIMHHNFPNIKGWDTDIEQSAMFKIYPHAPHTSFHKVQHYLIFLVYPLYLFNWLLIRDFKDFFSTKRTIKKTVEIPRKEYVKLFVFKFIFVLYTFVIPVVLGIPLLQVLLGFIVLTFTASIISLMVLLPPHANVHNMFPETKDNFNMETSWLEHQLNTTSDISTHNWFIAIFMGNFNYHIAHHLFPSLSYVHIPLATEVIKEYASKNRLRYKQFGLWESLKNHYKLVKQNSEEHLAIFDETF